MARSTGSIASAPVITTARLVLRGHRVGDWDDCAAMWGDPAVTLHISGKTFSKEETWSKLLRLAGLWALLGYGYWAVEEQSSGQFVGEVGFADFKRAIEPSLDGMPEAGWVLATWAHGVGYATEAVGAALAWSDEHLASRRTVCMIAPEHRASIRVAEKCGYRQFRRTTYKNQQALLFRR